MDTVQKGQLCKPLITQDTTVKGIQTLCPTEYAVPKPMFLFGKYISV